MVGICAELQDTAKHHADYNVVRVCLFTTTIKNTVQ